MMRTKEETEMLVTQEQNKEAKKGVEGGGRGTREIRKQTLRGQKKAAAGKGSVEDWDCDFALRRCSAEDAAASGEWE